MNWLSRITLSLRMTQIYTMICGVIINDLMRKKEESEMTHKFSINRDSEFVAKDLNPLVCLKEEDFTQTLEIELNDSFIGTHLEVHIQQINQRPSVDAKMIVHAPKVFRALQLSDKQMANIEKSFDLEDNLHAISKKFGGPDGGKSGEFFYFSIDHRLIIKTMNKSEFEACLKNLKKYVQHLVINENSMIVKIYGVYTFMINKQQNHILIMRNITQCPSEFIERTFDLKGSTYDREVRAKKQNKGRQLNEMTLKDIDFQKTEGKIWIDNSLSLMCSQSLEKDARFFEECGLIDYSLIVFKINWTKYSINTGQEVQDVMKNFHTHLNCIPSTKEIGIYYHIGIIDYLQEWNVQKNLEKSTKQLINLKGNLDTSSQNQKIYADRFISEIAQGIFKV